MGKTSRWLRALLGAKKSSSDSPTSSTGGGSGDKKTKWGLLRSSNHNNRNYNGTTKGFSAEVATSSIPYVEEALDPNKHAIAVAAATAAVAEAALAAAQAAAEVVRLTSSGGGSRAAQGNGVDRRREWAAVKIQSAFRAYLARRALRALKGLVKLQALVRGRIVRKQSADMLRRMQAMARIQARACASRAYISESSRSSYKSSQFHHAGLAYGTKFDESILKRCDSKSNIKNNVSIRGRHFDSNWLNHWMEESSWNSRKDGSFRNGRADDEKSDKILEIDTWKPHLNPSRSDKTFQASRNFSGRNYNEQVPATFDNLSTHSTKSQKPHPSLSSGEISCLRPLKYPFLVDGSSVWTAENSPCVHSASSRPGSTGRRSPFTPARSERSRSIFGDYLSHPNYMASTESSWAKMRSQSAPRQRIQFERPGSDKRFVRGF